MHTHSPSASTWTTQSTVHVASILVDTTKNLVEMIAFILWVMVARVRQHMNTARPAMCQRTHVPEEVQAER